MKQLISFELESDFAFFRKPQTNEGIQLSYNLVHKPSILGILGAIVGLEGYKEKGKWPEYYEKFKHIPIGITPIGSHDKGNFDKTVITYTNTVGYANADGNLIVKESTLLQAAYRIYLLLDSEQPIEQKLLEQLQKGAAVYVPYFGKNECPIWWDIDSVTQYEYEAFDAQATFKIESIFVKNTVAAAEGQGGYILPTFGEVSYAYFEEIPIGFNEELFQYELADIAYTNWEMSAQHQLEGLYQIKTRDKTAIIQLF